MFIFLPLLAFFHLEVHSAKDLPLLHLSEVLFDGAFRVPASQYGSSDMNYAQGPMEYVPETNSIFIVGHGHQQHIAEFSVPEIVNSKDVLDLEMSGEPIQEFAAVLSRVSNDQNIDRIGGIKYMDGELIVNGYEYYDAPGDNSVTTLVFRRADDLAGCEVDGFFTFEGGAGHTSGWISPIPAEWQQALGGQMITAQSSGIPIISRCSVGPSAFAFTPSDLLDAADVSTPIPTVKLLDYSLGNPLHEDLSNSNKNNDIWTHLSRVGYGLIVPGTRTYATFGNSGGHGPRGVCYKCEQDNGNLCGGYCTPDPNDNYLYYWFYDVNDFLDVKAGRKESHTVRPYAYGDLAADFPTTQDIGGGAFDPESGLMYLTLQRADREQGTYSNPPIIATYRFDVGAQAGRVAAGVVVGVVSGVGALFALVVVVVLVLLFSFVFWKGARFRRNDGDGCSSAEEEGKKRQGVDSNQK